MRYLAIAVLLFSCAGVRAFAAEPPEPPITEPLSIIDNVSSENVSGLLRELGATKVETVESAEGNKVVVFYDGDMPYNMGITGCDILPNKCIALVMVAILDGGSRSFPVDVFNDHNKNNLFLSLVKLEGNKFAAGRVFIVDGGITKKNFAINIASFVVNFQNALRFLAGQLVASNQTETATRPLSYSMVPPRAVSASPAEIAKLMKIMKQQYQTVLQPRR